MATGQEKKMDDRKIGDQHLARVFVEKTAGGVTTVEQRDIFASSQAEADTKLAALPETCRREYQNPSGVSVSVKSTERYALQTQEQLSEALRRDGADSDRQIDAWMR